MEDQKDIIYESSRDNQDNREIFPDTYGADAMFVSFFLNDEMKSDLPGIAIDFILHEAENLSGFSQVDYIGKEFREIDGSLQFGDIVLNMIFNAFRDGNLYAKLTLQNLYKTYYKAEYRSLKRYNTMDTDGIDSLAFGFDEDEGEEMLDYVIAARILTMCQVFDIEIKPETYFLFHSLDKQFEHYKAVLNEDAKDEPIKAKTMESVIDMVQNQISSTDTKELRRIRNIAQTFCHELVQRGGYFGDALEDLEDRELNAELIIHEYILAASMLKRIAPKENFTSRELIFFSVIIEIFMLLTRGISFRDELIEQISRADKDKASRYRAPKEADLQIEKKRTEMQKPTASQAISTGEDVTAGLKEEISRLRRDLKLETQKTEYVRQLYESNKEELDLQKAMVAALQADREELHRLRDFAYQQAEQDLTSVKKEDLDAMCDEIRDKKILVIGGHPNWTYKFKNMFPAWRFVDPSPSGSIDSKIMDNTDCALFFTDIITHSVYNKYIAIAREKKVPFGYLHATNVEASIREMYQAISGR